MGMRQICETIAIHLNERLKKSQNPIRGFGHLHRRPFLMDADGALYFCRTPKVDRGWKTFNQR